MQASSHDYTGGIEDKAGREEASLQLSAVRVVPFEADVVVLALHQTNAKIDALKRRLLLNATTSTYGCVRALRSPKQKHMIARDRACRWEREVSCWRLA